MEGRYLHRLLILLVLLLEFDYLGLNNCSLLGDRVPRGLKTHETRPDD